MSTTELVPNNYEVPQLQESRAPLTADAIYDCMESLSPLLEVARPDLVEMGLVGAEVLEVPTSNRHRILAVDASREPGGAFKFNGAAFGLWSLLRSNPDIRTVTTGTAGSFGAALAKAGEHFGLNVRIHSHAVLNPDNEYAMRTSGADIDKSHVSVLDAITAAKADAETNPLERAFIHPFNDPFCIKGQQLVGEQIAETLLRLQSAEVTNTRHQRAIILAQRGGGSLLGGIALAVKQRQRLGTLDSKVEVHGVRPSKLVGGVMDGRYDKLLVDQPGSWTKPVIEDKRYVQRHHEIETVDTARAAKRLAAVTPVEYEFSGLASLAAVEKLMRRTDEPTTFIAVLSGRNPAPGTYSQLKQVLARYEESLASQRRVTLERAAGNTLLSVSGATAAFRQGLIERGGMAVQPQDASRGEAVDRYYQQLEELGVVLVTRQHR